MGILSLRSFFTGSSPASINLLVYLSLYVTLRANGCFNLCKRKLLIVVGKGQYLKQVSIS